MLQIQWFITHARLLAAACHSYVWSVANSSCSPTYYFCDIISQGSVATCLRWWWAPYC